MPHSNPTPKHPAKYNNVLLPVFAEALIGCKKILDPFGGVGTIFKLEEFLPEAEISAVEIEKIWQEAHPKTILGDALDLPWPDSYFNAICVSPVFGNRMSDHHLARDDSKRNTYRHTLGQELQPNNSGQLQWGDEYREFHLKAWREARRVLAPGGIFVINCKDHVRNGKRKFVTIWHLKTLVGLGFTVIEHRRIPTPSLRFGSNSDTRIDCEDVVKLRLDRKMAGEEIPVGFCQCGCGGLTTIAPRTDQKYGWVKGEPLRYIYQHHYPIPANMEQLYLSWLPDQWSDDSCQIWQGSTIGTANVKRGRIWLGGKTELAHRVAYETAYGENPGDKNVCHTCDVPLCVNPFHLFLGSDQDNMADRDLKNRQPKGETHGMSKLTDQQVLEIRTAFHNGENRKEIANRYGINFLHVYNIGNRKTWKHLP